MIDNLAHLFSSTKCSVVWLTRKEHFMDDNLPSDPEFRRKICALTDPEPMVETPAAAETFTAAEVLKLIELTVNGRMRLFEQRMKNMLAD